MASLDFTSAALSAFAYLGSEFGFETTNVGSELVRFEGNGVFVCVRFDGHRSYELGVELGPLGPVRDGRERGFNLGEVLRLADAAEAEELTTVMVTEQATLERFVSKMAYCLRQYGRPLLRGEREALTKLGELSDRESKAYQHRKELRFAVEGAQRAWKRADYRKVVEELQRFEVELAPSERKRLAIARSRSR